MDNKYAMTNDEELVELFHSGDSQACNELIIRYKNLVLKKAKAMFIVGGDNDDLIQEGMIGLYNAVMRYTDQKGASFFTFASMCINSQMCTAIRLANSKKHGPLNGYVSLDAPIKSQEDGEEGEATLSDVLVAKESQNPEQMILERDAVRELENQCGDVLSDLEKEVLSLHMEGLGYTEIASRLNKSPKSIDNAIQRIRTKLNTLRL